MTINTEKEYELRLKHMELAMANGRHHETVRNNTFNYYVILVGLFFAGVSNLSEMAPHKPIPPLVAVLIFILGLILSAMILRISIMIMRDVRVIEAASSYTSISPNLKPMDNVYRSYYVEKWSSENLKKWGVSTYLILAITTISSGGVGLGFLIFTDSYYISSGSFLFAFLFHYAFVRIVSARLNSIESITEN